MHIRFKSIMNLNWFKFTACDLVNPVSMLLVNDRITVEEGKTSYMDFEPYDASERQLEYLSDDESIASVSALGEKDASRMASFHGIIRSVSVLGYCDMPEYKRIGEALKIYASFVHADKPVVFRIVID